MSKENEVKKSYEETNEEIYVEQNVTLWNRVKGFCGKKVVKIVVAAVAVLGTASVILLTGDKKIEVGDLVNVGHLEKKDDIQPEA